MANKFFGAIDLIGGTDGALDSIDDAAINDLDGAYVIDSTQRIYTYNLDASSGATEDSPRIIEPNSGSNKRWLLNTMVAKSLVVSENAEYVYGTDTGENEEGILRINASDDTEVRAQSGNSVDIIVSATKVADFAAAGLTLASGATIDEFGTDGTLAGDEDTVVPTEKAVKTYADAVATTAAGLVTTHEADTSTHGVTTIAGLTEVQTMTNKTLTSPVLNTGVSGTAVLDEDNMASNSNTQLATQQSIKAYIDTSHPGATNFFVAATHVFFAQATPPTGWTIDAAHKDNVLACKSDAGTYSVVGANKGSWTYTGFTKDAHVHAGPSHTHTMPTHLHTTGDHTLNLTEIPSHSHLGNAEISNTSVRAYYNAGSVGYYFNTAQTGTAGGGTAHNHGNTGSIDPGDTNADGTANTGAQSGAGITHDGADRPYATVGVIATYTA